MEAGNLIRERFNSFNVIQEKDEFGDVVTEVDLLAEEMIINEISRVFPNHQVQGEVGFMFLLSREARFVMEK